jgi:hypothetical protein
MLSCKTPKEELLVAKGSCKSLPKLPKERFENSFQNVQNCIFFLSFTAHFLLLI